MEVPLELIVRCQAGEAAAEHELYKRLYSFLMSICRRYVRQEEKAREVLNLGFYRVLTKIGKYEPVAPFHFWARKVMVNVIINELRREKLHYGNHTYVETYYEDEKYCDLNVAIARYDVDHLVALIEKLPRASAQVFNLFVVDGLNHREIAALLGISEGTSKWHLSSAREKLRAMLTEKKTITVTDEATE